MADVAAKLEFLRRAGASEVAHSRRTLLDHLMGTRELLAAWGAPPSWCDAGLFHSVYGTAPLPRAMLGEADRDAVRELIGAEAERLAWLFGSIDRHAFVALASADRPACAPGRRDREALALTAEEVAGLANLAVANDVEQLPRRGRAHRRRTAARLSLEQHLLPGAVDSLRRAPPRLARLFG